MTKLLIFGGAGMVGSRFIDLNSETFEISAPDVSEIDILNPEQVEKAFADFKPEAVINFAAYTNVEEAENQKGDKNGICYRINVEGAGNVADACEKNNAHLIHISTEYVFDGTKKETGYSEDDKPNPINWYGQTKHFADIRVVESGCGLTIARISMPFTAKYELKKDVARFFVGELKAGNKIRAIEDQFITPTLVDDIAGALRIFVERKKQGTYHIASKNSTTPFGFAKLLAVVFGLKTEGIEPVLLEEYNRGKKAPLLKYSWLDASKFINEFGVDKLHTIEESVKIFKEAVDSSGGN